MLPNKDHISKNKLQSIWQLIGEDSSEAPKNIIEQVKKSEEIYKEEQRSFQSFAGKQGHSQDQIIERELTRDGEEAQEISMVIKSQSFLKGR